MIISQSSGAQGSKAMLKRQIEDWRQQEADGFINRNRLKIYALCAGLLVFPISSGDRHSSKPTFLAVYEGLDWKRCFALHLWFEQPAPCGIPEAISSYSDHVSSLNAENVAPEQSPTPYYREVDPKLPASEAEDICYRLIKFYSGNGGFSLEQVLVSEGVTPYLLDVQLIWHLNAVLSQINHVQQLSPARETQLHLAFAAQLEVAGLWQWGAFVLQYISNPNHRAKSIADLIERNVAKISINTEEQLTRDFGISSQLVKRAQATYAGYKGDRAAQTRFLCEAGLYSEAHDVLVTHVMHTAITSNSQRRITELGALVDFVAAHVDSPVGVIHVVRGYLALLNATDVILHSTRQVDRVSELHQLADSDLKALCSGIAKHAANLPLSQK